MIPEPDSDALRLISRWCGTKEGDLSFGAANFGAVYQIWQQSTTSAPEILHVTNFAAARPLEFMCYRNQIGPKPHRRSSQRQAYITGKIFCNFDVVGGTSCAIFIYFRPSQPAARADVFYSGGSDRHDDMNDMTKAMIPKPITHYETKQSVRYQWTAKVNYLIYLPPILIFVHIEELIGPRPKAQTKFKSRPSRSHRKKSNHNRTEEDLMSQVRMSAMLISSWRRSSSWWWSSSSWVQSSSWWRPEVGVWGWYEKISG